MLGANLSGSGVDDPDAYFFERFAYGSERNYTNYCNPELDTAAVSAVDCRLAAPGSRPSTGDI
jgi:hypothetical protein